MADIKKLKARIAELEAKLAEVGKESTASGGQHRGKIAHMSAEVVDSNPYRFVKSSTFKNSRGLSWS